MSEIISSLGVQDFIALAIVAAAAAAAVYYIKKRKKNGCCGSCSGCAFAEECHKKERNENETENKL